MNIQSQEQVKGIVSALRRELKLLGDKPASQLSHTECLELLAKAMGRANWNTWKAELPEKRSEQTCAAEPVAAQPPAPEPVAWLPDNLNGEYDFVTTQKRGQLMSGAFLEIKGCWDRLNGVALISSAKRGAQELDVDWSGETEIIWDDQTTVKNAQGEKLYSDEDGNLVPESQIVLMPRSFNIEDLPVRNALVEDYLLCLPRFMQDASVEYAIDRLQDACGIHLTPQEREEVVKRLHEQANKNED